MKNSESVARNTFDARVIQNRYLFPTREIATDYANRMKIPADRIFQFPEGWAIQRNILGPYFGPKGWWPQA